MSERVGDALSYYVLLLSGLDSINFDSFIVNKPSINRTDTWVLCAGNYACSMYTMCTVLCIISAVSVNSFRVSSRKSCAVSS